MSSKLPFLAALSLLAAGAVPALADHRTGHPKPGTPAPAPGGQTLTLAPATQTRVFNPFLNPPGGVATFTGQLKGTDNAGKVIVLEANPAPLADNRFARTGRETTTDAQGRFRFTGIVAGVNSQYRAEAPALRVTSNTALVRVRLRVSFGVSDSTPRRGQKVRFRGKIWPEKDGQPVAIQRRGRDGVYRTIKRTVARDAVGQSYSTYSTVVRIFRTGRFRVVARSGDALHVSGISRARTLRIG